MPLTTTITWVPTIERLPDANERILLVYRGAVFQGNYMEAHGLNFFYTPYVGRIAPQAVTHWAPMPTVEVEK